MLDVAGTTQRVTCIPLQVWHAALHSPLHSTITELDLPERGRRAPRRRDQVLALIKRYQARIRNLRSGLTEPNPAPECGQVLKTAVHIPHSPCMASSHSPHSPRTNAFATVQQSAREGREAACSSPHLVLSTPSSSSPLLGPLNDANTKPAHTTDVHAPTFVSSLCPLPRPRTVHALTLLILVSPIWHN